MDAVTLRRERAVEAAASVWVLAGEDLRDQGFRTLADALRSVPGLSAHRDDYYRLVGVRGLGLLGDETTRVLVLVDGHPLNNSLGLSQSYVGRDFPVPMDAIERVEVLKGPAGSLYGPTAFLGVVNVVTREAREGAAISARGEASQGRASAGSIGLQRGARWEGGSIFLTAEAYGSRGQQFAFPELAADAGRPAPAGGRVRGADASGALTALAKGSLGAAAFSGSCSGWSGGLPTAPYSARVADARNEATLRTCWAEVSLERPLARGLTLLARASYDDFETRDRLGYAAPPDGFGTYRDVGTDRWLSGELRLTWQPWAGALLVGGATAEGHRTLQHSFADGVPTVLEDPVDGAGVGPIRKDFATLNTYLLSEVALVPGTLRAHAGLTFYAHGLFGSRVTPKAALVWTPTAADVVKAVYAEGFRAPTLCEALFEDGTDYVANRRLRPETVRSGELVWERRIAGRASLVGSAFVNHYRDLVRYVTVPAPGLGREPDPANPSDFRQMAENVDGLTQRGAELALNLDLGHRLRAWGGVSVQEVRGSAVANFPAVTGNLALASRALWRPLRLALSGSYAAGRGKDPSTLGPASRASVGPAVVLNASATLDVPRARGLSVQLGVANLLDASAATPLAGDDAPITEIADAPRTLFLTLRWSR